MEIHPPRRARITRNGPIIPEVLFPHHQLSFLLRLAGGAGKEEWIEERYKEGKWADIRVLDATDIAEWLEQAPAVARWFAQLIGKTPDSGFICIDEWWEQWTGSTKPRISPELVLAGRHPQAEAVLGWFMDSACSWYVCGDTREEAAAFLAATFLSPSAEKGNEFFAKAVVVETTEAWHDLQHHPFPLVLVRSFAGNVSSSTAVAKGHHVLTLLDRTQTPLGEGQTLHGWAAKRQSWRLRKWV